MIVVIDTNTLLQALSSSSPFRPVLEAWFSGRLTWVVSTEILLEYEEVIVRNCGVARWVMFQKMREMVEELRPPSFKLVSPTFRFRLITADPDDDKFADAAITAGADFIITADRHFETMRHSGHRPQPITPEDFIENVLSTL